ncbi:sigma-70 family RNA polymerase sigma factor [Sphingomonas sp. ID0503]|uniref:sigma-70 family RNA polymerase sigma factor n=1 Tax=Sphingomonas sp. ID0503 TaxID=3399691 RepID=UPI003AFAFCF8
MAEGLEGVLLAHRAQLLRFLAAHGAGAAAEDLLQELWLKVAASDPGPVANPLSYLYRAANNLMVDRHRASVQAAKRDAAWNDASTTVPGQSDVPSDERAVIARDQLRHADAALEALGERTAAIFRRHRIDGVQQKDIAREFGVSLSTVEADLRKAYRAMIDLRRRFDEG